jgi:hypothetical protein
MASGREGAYGQAALQGGLAAFQGFSAYMGARGLQASRMAAGSSEEIVTLYRGVESNHTMFNAAQQGMAISGKTKWWQFWKGRTTSVLEHNTVAGATKRSPFTSWTTDKRAAEHFATWVKGQGHAGQGVIMKVQVPKRLITTSPNRYDIFLNINGKTKLFSEAESLLKGVIQADEVIKVTRRLF